VSEYCFAINTELSIEHSFVDINVNSCYQSFSQRNSHIVKLELIYSISSRSPLVSKVLHMHVYVNHQLVMISL